MVYRVYVEKMKEHADEARSLLNDLRSLLMITSLEDLRIVNRYDVENIDEALFEKCINTVFSEPQVDVTYRTLPEHDGCTVFATEYLPGQYDQRADSAAQCVQLVSQGDRPNVRTAKVYILKGALTDAETAAVKNYVINPVESREASLEAVPTLKVSYSIPEKVRVFDGFISYDSNRLAAMIKEYGLAMDLADITFCQEYFRSEHRDPTITEIRILDTYWSDHCRHTTFSTQIENVEISDADIGEMYNKYLSVRKELGRDAKPVTLMDLATMGARFLKHTGQLKNLDESEEINACTVKIKVDVEGKTEDWLFLFKNETHNHPTEIEPFGGAATCIGGAIRDPLSGRSYVYQAMRVTGAADPLLPVSQTMKGKLPQRKIVTTAAAGYSSYGNQIGLATGLVDELYHPGYAAKRMEIGAVVGAAPAANVRREVPQDGDIVVLLGGRTGRDGCGGATGSSKSHDLSSLENCGAEVQKGNAPIERKLQRLFRDPEATAMIKRCNDFGAGGVSVAIGELADGLRINLDAVPKKYDGLDGTELAISESQERMAIVLEKENVDKFIALAEKENLEATVVAVVTASPRMVLTWNGFEIANISRDFLNSNGAPKYTSAKITDSASYPASPSLSDSSAPVADRFASLVSDLNVCSKRGLSERFDSTIGAATVLMPFGGKYQQTPAQSMVAKLPVLGHETKTCSAMAYGYNPYITEASPFAGAYLAVTESVSKLIASGAPLDTCYLTFQEYFERLRNEPSRWGKPLSALLGALKAQLELGIASIGGKDSMSGSFENIDVPPTLVSFAVSIGNTDNIISPEFKSTDSKVMLLSPVYDKNGLPTASSLLSCFAAVSRLIADKKIISAYTPGFGGIAEGIFKMSIGNRIGFKFDSAFDIDNAFKYAYGSFILELADTCSPADFDGIDGTLDTLGQTQSRFMICTGAGCIDAAQLQKLYEGKLESVFACNIATPEIPVEKLSYTLEKRVAPKIGVAKPKVLIPVFPGTNCEYDTAKALMQAGAQPETVIINNLSAEGVARSVKEFAHKISESQIIFIPGGFSGGDEPDGSGKFITAFFRNPAITEQVHELLNNRDGLMCGICNGFQALIKLGLVPFGKIIDTDADSPTLSFNRIGRHQSKLVRTRIASNKSPWLRYCNVGDIHLVPVSHGEGRFICGDALLAELAANGQIATQYVDLDGNPTMDIAANPNGSVWAIEGITSPDGRIFGKMAHSERKGDNLYKNVDGIKDNGMFRGAVDYFKI